MNVLISIYLFKVSLNSRLGIFVSLLSDYILVKASDLTLLQSDISASLEKTTQNIVSSVWIILFCFRIFISFMI